MIRLGSTTATPSVGSVPSFDFKSLVALPVRHLFLVVGDVMKSGLNSAIVYPVLIGTDVNVLNGERMHRYIILTTTSKYIVQYSVTLTQHVNSRHLTEVIVVILMQPYECTSILSYCSVLTKLHLQQTLNEGTSLSKVSISQHMFCLFCSVCLIQSYNVCGCSDTGPTQ